MEATNTERIGKYLIEIYPDQSPDSPREWDNLGTMVCFHKRYDLGDKHDYDENNYDSWDELKEDIIKQENVHTILHLYLYDHSGITMNTTGFSCRWDSGQVGWIFVSKDKVKKDGIDESKIEQYLNGEVETYDQYLTGDVWGYRVYEVETCSLGHEHKVLVDSCWGFFGEEYAEKEGRSLLEHYEKDLV